MCLRTVLEMVKADQIFTAGSVLMVDINTPLGIDINHFCVRHFKEQNDLIARRNFKCVGSKKGQLYGYMIGHK